MIEAINWGKNKIELLTARFRTPTPLSSIALHHKEDGAIGDLPSLLFECRDQDQNMYYHEFSLETLNTALNKFGYKIVPSTNSVMKLLKN